ncbi:hypothetical protein CAEBREN_01028 [Caenorhabditis brenneri]|uniref:Uncharacterized protein n=1 Tax=Caenorhabditis brenneri TaxID=135651 RepID=G0NLF6_CAEBE|nr:hypothetical protein CAEBREN_01028 [Caenorhabditis brenneri]
MKWVLSCILCTALLLFGLIVVIAIFATNHRDWSNHPPHRDHPRYLNINHTAGSLTNSTQISSTVIDDYEDNGRSFDGNADDDTLKWPSRPQKRHVTTESPDEEEDSEMDKAGLDPFEKTGDKRIGAVKAIEEDPTAMMDKRSKDDSSANENNGMVSGSKKPSTAPTQKPLKTAELKKFVGGSDEIIEEEEEEEIVVKKKHSSSHDN